MNSSRQTLAGSTSSFIFPNGLFTCVICGGISWSCAMQYPCLLLGPIEISSYREPPSSRYSVFLCLFSFFFLRVVVGRTKKLLFFTFSWKRFHGRWSLFFFFPSFSPPPASSFYCHPPIPHIFQPKMSGIKLSRIKTRPGVKLSLNIDIRVKGKTSW